MSFSKAIGVISSINECVTLFQWVKSAISSLPFQWSGTQEQKLQEQILHFESRLQRLRETLPTMYDLIDRAEWRNHDPCVFQLLPVLKDAVYDADDLLDEFRWYEFKMQVEVNNVSQPPSVDFFNSVVKGSFNKVDALQERLNSISMQLKDRGLHEVVHRFDESMRPVTSSLPIEEKIFGREKELKEVIELLGVPMKSSSTCSKRKRRDKAATTFTSNQLGIFDGNESRIASAPVLPIIGIGGVGKTTLAQHISKHRKVISHFKKIIWICVSDDFDVKRLTKEALQSFSDKMTNTDNLDSLQHALANEVKKGRFLLILDDMWDDAMKENGQRWQRFYAPFKNVPDGSILLVTTRSIRVAEGVRTNESFKLEGLKMDIFWDFFKLCVFGSKDSNSYPELEQIGRTILPKLKGSPLAAKTLGRLLGMSLDTIHWNNILKSELWELRQEETDILPALRLSYMYLPLRLKRCFAFCAVYPKNHRFNKITIAQFWVAEGFVVPEGNLPLQQIGCQYFENLVNWNFFQRFRGSFVIHDLMHDMAQLVAKDECFIIKNRSDFLKVPQNVRHLSICQSSDVQCYDLLSLCKHRKLRTLLCSMSLRNNTGTDVMEKWCTELQSMRVIVCASVRGLTESINNMKHLRYLEVFKPCHFKNFPSALYSLYNLQFLYVRRCEFDNFPRGFGKLISLQIFESKKFQFFQGHGVKVHSSATDEEHRKQLRLSNYPNESLPIWFHPESLPNLTSLVFYGCSKFKSISIARNSQSILVYGLPGMLADNNDDTNGTYFPSLVDLDIGSCENLSSLEQFLQPTYMPAIRKIHIHNCQNLISLPTTRLGDLHFLEELEVSSCPNIYSSCLFPPSLKKLKLENCGHLVDNINCVSLTKLDLSYLNLKSLQPQTWNLPSLQKLMIKHSKYLEFIGGSGRGITNYYSHQGGNNSRIGIFSSLTHLEIWKCEKLLNLDGILTNEYLPAIESIQFCSCELLAIPTEIFRTFSFLKNLEITDCQGLDWRSGMVLPSSLQRLTLWSCGDFSSWFPNCLENLTSLQLLKLVSCDGIVSIPGHLWSSSLASTHELWIRSCPDLVSIGGPNAIVNVEVVRIEGCPKLEKSIKQPMCRGKLDWKI